MHVQCYSHIEWCTKASCALARKGCLAAPRPPRSHTERPNPRPKTSSHARMYARVVCAPSCGAPRLAHGAAPCACRALTPHSRALTPRPAHQAVYASGAAAGVALPVLLQHEARLGLGSGSGGGGGVPSSASASASSAEEASALAADAARWLQLYHGSLLRHPEGALQTALALPASSAVRAAALAALHTAAATAPAAAAAATGPTGPAVAVAAVAGGEEEGGGGLSRPFVLTNPDPDWDLCLLNLEGYQVTRGVVGAPSGLMATASGAWWRVGCCGRGPACLFVDLGSCLSWERAHVSPIHHCCLQRRCTQRRLVQMPAGNLRC